MTGAMDESRRRAYLRAMGIDLWMPLAVALPPAATQGPAPAIPAPMPPPPGTETAWEEVSAPILEVVAPTSVPVPAVPETSPRPTQPPAIPLFEDPATLDWDALATAVAACRACGLGATRTQTVFGVGNRQARLLVIGEAPGADEDREGEPFVGRAGQLLNQMLAAIGLERGQVYIANILKCRPPGNRNPLPVEVEHCQGYLARQVALIRPRVILSVGAISAQTLLGTDTPVGRLRGRWFDYGPAAIPLRVTYHPAYLLRSPEQKGKAWEDLIEVARRLGAD